MRFPILAVLFLILLTTPASAQEPADLIADGGFESGVLDTVTARGEASYGKWIANAPGQGPNTLELRKDTPSGTYAVYVDTAESVNGRWLYQDMESGSECFTWSVKMRTDFGWARAEILQDWDRGGGSALFVSMVQVRDSELTLHGWGSSVAAGRPEPGRWYEYGVVVDPAKNTQILFIDGEEAATLEVESTGWVAETIIMGDVGGGALKATASFDDVSIIPGGDCDIIPHGETEATITAEEAAKQAGAPPDTDEGSSMWWLWVLLAVILFLIFFAWRRSQREEEPATGGDDPPDRDRVP